MRLDWTSAALRRRIAGGRRQALGRALGLARRPGLRILDATAGLGRDGFVMAALGAQVTMVERHPLLVTLLRAAHARAETFPHSAIAADRIVLRSGDARDHLDGEFDVIYLDPMYATERRTALPRRELRFLSALYGPDADAGELLSRARGVARQRVVVKRDRRAPALSVEPPDLTVRSTQLRFDIYLTP